MDDDYELAPFTVELLRLYQAGEDVAVGDRLVRQHLVYLAGLNGRDRRRVILDLLALAR